MSDSVNSGKAGSEDPVVAIRQLAGPGQSIVFVSGNFNIVHPGHLRLLNFAAECGDFLVVAVKDNSSPGAKLSQEMRLEGVGAISLVNFAFVLTESVDEFIRRLKPAVVVKGKEFEGRHNSEQSVVETYGGKLLFSSGEVRFSSLDLLRREYFETNLSTIRKPKEFLGRHKFDMGELRAHLQKFRNMRVMVLGDLIVDDYINCDPIGMSQEDPTIVVTPIESKRFVGGAGIVAAHAKGLGAEVNFFTIAGNDEAAWFAKQTLRNCGVNHHVLTDNSRPTTLKQRFRAEGKTLLRVSHLRQHDASAELSQLIFEALEKVLSDTDLIIFSDFNYGCLPQGLVDRVVDAATKLGIAMVADSQASSQVSDISRFKGMRLITPTEREARLALHDQNSGLAVVAEALRQKAQADNVVITLGSEGLLVHARNTNDWITDQLPTFNTSPKDTAGAGDSFLTCAAMALCSGLDIWRSVYLGSIAAACQVSRVGNTPLTQADLISELEQP